MTLEFHRLGALQGAITNPNRVPSKAAGRKGTRRAWKRAHPPGWSNRLFAFFDRPCVSFCDAFRDVEKGA